MFAKILLIIFIEVLSKDIGLKSDTLMALSCLGIKVI